MASKSEYGEALLFEQFFRRLQISLDYLERWAVSGTWYSHTPHV